MLDRVEFMFSEALTALRRNTWMSFAAITTSCMALFLLGGMAFAYRGIAGYAETLPSKLEVRVFLKEQKTGFETKSAIEQIGKLKGVGSVTMVTKAEAWAKMQREMPDITKGITNPLPDALNITLKDVDSANNVAAAIRKMPIVERDGVKYEGETQALLSQTLTLLRWVGSALGGLMLLTGAVLIYNAIRMTIVARRREIRIMSLVGATRLTIVVPLLIEGIVQGAIGGLLAAILIVIGHQMMMKMLVNFASFIRVGALPIGMVFGSLVALGAVYGLICSLFAVRDPRGIA
ncbi:MAG: ABC transporter permease [Chthonomonas sp.]|nr:ABC transporter permease [Chthonomonas sp.]